MSWDIFVQDLPSEAHRIADIPDDFMPQPIGKRSEIIEKILEVVPVADFSDPSWGIIDGLDFAIEVNIGHDEIVDSFAFHVRGGDTGAGIVADILDHLNLRALDPNSESSFFERETAVQNLNKWREYRNRVIG